MAESSRAEWTIVHRDPDVLLLRGRFPVASLIGMGGTYDVVAMVPNDATCAAVAESGTATLVFRTSGSKVFELGPCEVLAFARPL